MSNTFSKIWILAILILLVVGGIFAWQYFGKQGEELNTSGVTKDETADWQTYRNEEFGFEVGYPTSWKVSEQSGITSYTVLDSADYSGETISSPIANSSSSHSGTRVIINRYENPRNFTPDQLVADYPVQQGRRIVEVDGVQGVMVDTIVEFGIHETVVVLVSESFVYQINRIYPEGQKEQYAEIFNQILSTFKFLETERL
ncbi:MAG: PsbP-related protein [bacterium]|nr:PsbP-related protein [bacterium]